MAATNRFTKGHAKKGGKVKGSRNKKTLLLESFTKVCIDGGMDKFQRELMKLKGGNYVKNFMALLEFVQPKLQRTEHTGKGGKELPPTQIIVKDEATKKALEDLK